MQAISTSTRIFLFIALNIIDIALTAFAISLGASEMNYIYAAARNPVNMMALKMMLAGLVISGLLMFRRTDMLHLVNIGMVLVVLWNIVAIISWSL
jgi:hypothetical protein